MGDMDSRTKFNEIDKLSDNLNKAKPCRSIQIDWPLCWSYKANIISILHIVAEMQ